MAIEIGKKAPAFTLLNDRGEKVAMKDLAGEWVVLYFYPKADTPGCTVEACEFTEVIDDFADLDAKVVGISPDEPAALAKFREKHGLKVELLADPEKQVMPEYGAWGEKNMYGRKSEGVIRSTVLIDPQGKVAHHWKKVSAEGHAEKVKQKLEELAAAG